jgi:hypothetical protein
MKIAQQQMADLRVQSQVHVANPTPLLISNPRGQHGAEETEGVGLRDSSVSPPLSQSRPLEEQS